MKPPLRDAHNSAGFIHGITHIAPDIVQRRQIVSSWYQAPSDPPVTRREKNAELFHFSNFRTENRLLRSEIWRSELQSNREAK
jgi:hypothetical protein